MLPAPLRRTPIPQPAAMPRARAHVFIATSVDGYIAREDGALDWLAAAHQGVPEGEDFGHAAFMAASEVLVMGSATYATVLGFEPWPYAGTPVVVMSRRAGTAQAPPVPAHLAAGVRCSAESPHGLLQRLGHEGVARVYLDGGRLVQAFLHEGLVDSLTVTQVPVLLGRGRPLWAPPAHPMPVHDQALRLQASRHWPNGVVQNVWVRAEPAA